MLLNSSLNRILILLQCSKIMEDLRDRFKDITDHRRAAVEKHFAVLETFALDEDVIETFETNKDAQITTKNLDAYEQREKKGS